jgi:YbbR domain-containing protein
VKPPSSTPGGHNIVLMVVSLALAIGGWVYVQAERSTRDQMDTLQVQARNLGEDLVVVPKPRDMPTAEIDLTGSQEELRQVDKLKVSAYVNLSGLQVGKHRVPVRIDARGIPLNVMYSLRRPYIDVEIQQIYRTLQKVTVRQEGSPPAGFQVVAVEAQPDSIQLSGAMIDVLKVRTARVTYDLAKAQEEPVDLEVQLFDAKEFPVEDVTVYPPRVTVSAAVAPVPAIKALPVQPTWMGQLPVGFKLERYELQPPQVRVTAESTLLAKMSAIETLPIDLSGIRNTRDIKAKIKLPKGFTAVAGDTVSVKVYIVPAPKPKVETPPSNTPPP